MGSCVHIHYYVGTWLQTCEGCRAGTVITIFARRNLGRVELPKAIVVGPEILVPREFLLYPIPLKQSVSKRS